MTDHLDVDGDDHPFDLETLFQRCEMAQEVEDAIQDMDSVFYRYAQSLKTDAVAAIEDLCGADPNDAATIITLQGTIERYVKICEWASDLLKDGEEAASQISLNSPPIDLAPPDAARDQFNEDHDGELE